MIICVQGLGYVGSAMCVAIGLAKNKFKGKNLKIIGVEKPTVHGKQIISNINKGIFPFRSNDLKLKYALKQIKRHGLIKATSSTDVYKKADVISVSVNCDLIRVKGKIKVDLSKFKKCVVEFAKKIKENTLIIIESTIPPGTCTEIVYPTIKKIFLKRKLNPNKVYIAHSSERVTPGKNYLSSVVNSYRVYSGINKKSEIKCKNFLSKVINVKKYPLYKLKNTNSSELSKLMENSYRAVNIAFVDEWSRLAEKINVDLFDVINAIKKRPTHNNLKDPGFGVGGYCLTKDPLMAMVGVKQIFNIKQNFQFSKLAVKTNNSMPLSTVNTIKRFYSNDLKGIKILLCGVTYKEDIDDTRYSPSELFFKKMNYLGAKVKVQDPLARYWDEVKINISSKIVDIKKFDAVVFAVKHKEYHKINFSNWKTKKRNFLIIDANNVLTKSQLKNIKKKKFKLISIGRGV